VAAIGGRARTIAVDRPGWDGHRSATDLKGNADAAIATLDAHGIPRATIVGHSFGGAVAACLAADHPERVGALVLAAPAANVACLYWLDYWLAGPVTGYVASAATIGGLGLALGIPRARRRLAAQLALDERYLAAAGRVLRAPATWQSFLTEQRFLIGDLPALEARLGQISTRARVVIGSADRVVPAASARTLATQIPGAQLVPLRHAGHLLPLQHAERLAEIILGTGGAGAVNHEVSLPRSASSARRRGR
jgi:pimeloyl-ACP methyl ester carboxylesterase